MNRIFTLAALLCLISYLSHEIAAGGRLPENPYTPEYVLARDTFPGLAPRYNNSILDGNGSPFDLQDPSAVKKEVTYDPATGLYLITERIGDDFYRAPTYMTFEEYLDYRAQQQERSYFNQLSGIDDPNKSGSGRVDPIADIDIENSLVDRLFGGTEVNIVPQGNIDLTFGVDYQNVQNPVLTQRQQRQGGFDFDMAIQMSVEGSIGEKLRLSTNYNTQATFNFDNQMKLDYNTDDFSEDEIIKKIEAGNVSLPLRGSLIPGSQSLFGLKTELQFGKLRLTLLASQQNADKKDIQIQGGAQTQYFEVRADEYDENRHFFLSHFNRNNYEEALTNLPQIKTLFRLERIEVWITNDRNVTENVVDIAAISDLGEPQRITNENPQYQAPAIPRYPDLEGEALADNNANDLYGDLIANPANRAIDRVVNTLRSAPYNFQQPRDFEKVSARLLSPTEYTYHPELGFVSLNVNVQPDQVVGVAYQYSYGDSIYQVGEFSEDIPPGIVDTTSQNVLFVRMLKSSTQRVDVPNWDLMMKNVYSLGAYQVNPRDFRLDIFYESPGGGDLRFLPEGDVSGVPLLRLFNLDRLNTLLDPQPDGVFDFVPGVTINPQNGRIYFPVLEPFGEDLAEVIDDPLLERRYVYDTLYSSTVTLAREFAEFNRFVIRGEYKSSISSEISLGAFNIPQGSVRVTAGGQILREGIDYEIDYNIGRLRILNDAYLNAGTPVRVSFEDNTLFGFQRKTMLGMRADYEVNKNLQIGGTFLNLFERPFTQKVNIGSDPINNKVYGLDMNYSAEAPWLTKAVDAIPGISTKETSTVTLTAEAAALQPGHSRAINEDRDEQGGIVYVDDFEGSVTNIDLRAQTNIWTLASVPQNDNQNNNPLFPEADLINDLAYGYNRAKLNWYRIDAGGRNGGLNTQNNSDNPYFARIARTEVFPNFTSTSNLIAPLFTFDLTYYPDERGQYNYELPNGSPFSAGLEAEDQTLKLAQPETRWAGIMRDISTTDFQATNIEYIEFWMLSPFLNEDGSGAPAPDADQKEGDMYINLGNISEDILRDSRKFFENGLPGPNDENPASRIDETVWGNVPIQRQINNAFDNVDLEKREAQDVGLDGMTDEEERDRYADYLQVLDDAFPASIVDPVRDDPARDNYVSFRDDLFTNDPDPDLDLFDAFFNNNGTQGNSAANNANSNGLTAFGTNIPDSEDLNRDNSLNETESYFQYRIPIRHDGQGGIDLNENPFITDVRRPDQGDGVNRIWYRFKVPLDLPDENPLFTRVGGIQNFRSIRFIRMYLKGFETQTTLRMATLDLVRNQWRRYQQELVFDGVNCPVDNTIPTTFDVNAVNIEENADKVPFPYILPPGIIREQALGVNQNALQNEQSLAITVEDLPDCDSRSIYKLTNIDLRLYERLRMFLHAERRPNSDANLDDGDLTAFIRVGSDFTKNYYEYEIPLVFSDENSGVPPGTPEYQRVVWPEANEMDLPLTLFTELKTERNANAIPLNLVYSFEDPDKPEATVRIKGNPNLGQVKGVMIGVRNPDSPDRAYHSAEVWVNELRAFGLDESGGVAALVRADFQMADFANLSLSGKHTTVGYGGIDQQLYERSRDEITELDAAVNMELGKFLPSSWGVSIPFLAQYSNRTATPQYDPYDYDVELKDKLRDTDSAAARDSIRRAAQDVTEIKSLNVTNLRKERSPTNTKPKPWDISNFSLSYSYTETENRDPIIESDQIDLHRGALDYGYSRKATYIKPFEKVFKKDQKWLALIQDLNFNPLPNSFGFSTVMDRQISETKYRFAGDDPFFNTFYLKRWTWDRSYNLVWDFSKAVKINFNALNIAVIDELDEFDQETGIRTPDEVKREFVWNNIRDLGRTKNYNHNLGVNVTLPLKQIPALDWMTVRGTYNAGYTWSAASLNVLELGNVIQNNQSRQLTADLDFAKIYQKSKFLSQIDGNSNRRRSSSRTRRGATRERDNKEEDEKDKKEKKEKKDKELSKGAKLALRPLLLLRRANLTYSEDFGTIIPGFLPQTRFLGLDDGFNNPGWEFVAGLQPNIDPEDYYTEDDYLYNNFSNISGDLLLNRQVQQTYSQTISGRLTIEPVKDLKIDINADRTFTENHTEFFRRDTLFGTEDDIFQEEYSHQIPREVGSFTMSFIGLSTLFREDKSFAGGPNELSALFNSFEDNRLIISRRLGNGTHIDSLQGALGYTEGYGRYQQDVLVPAFLAAYTNEDASTMDVSDNFLKNNLFNRIPLPNWRLTYNGLSKLKGLKELFQSFTLTHGYRGTLTVNSFESDLNYQVNDPFRFNPITNNFFSRFEVPNVVIAEQFAPLLGIDTRLQNGMSLRLDFKKARNLQMRFTDYSLSETKTTEYTVGFGYRLQNVDIPFLTGSNRNKGRSRRDQEEEKDNDEANNRGNRRGGNRRGGGRGGNPRDLDFNFDFSFRDDITNLRLLDQDIDVPTRGTRAVRISPSVDYVLSKQLTLRMFVDYSRTVPKVSTSFPITNVQGGVTVRFTLAP